jgi:hypothetical protein
MLRRQTVAAIVRLRLPAAAIVRRRWEQRPSSAARSNLRQPKIVGDSVRSRRRAIDPPLHRAWDRLRSVELTSLRRQRIAAATDRPILLRGARRAAARTRTGEAAAITGIERRRATVRSSSSGATAVPRTRVVAMGVAHLRVHSSICASRLYALRRMAAVGIRGPATTVAADTVRRLPATVVRIVHRAAVVPRRMAAEVVDITAAEVEVVADITAAAEAAVRAPAAEVVDIRAVAAATPVEVIAKSS